MLPVVALVGRPNVGKSTLFNRITGTRDAIVANYSGLTRDRKYGEAFYAERRFMLVDTGGLSSQEEFGIDLAMANQSLQAIVEADAVLLLVDARAGLMPDDEWIIKQLRLQEKPFLLVANKTDGINLDIATAEFFRIGSEKIYPITATHGKGIEKLMDDVVTMFPAEAEDTSHLATGIKIGVVGRPNVGKSTLVNRMLGEERVVVYDQPGTTRDSIYINYERHERPYTLIDTAGIRRKRSVSETVEKFSIVKTLQAIDDSNVVVLVVDAQENLVEQDLHLLGLCIQSGRALVIAINKWDGLSNDQRERIKSEIDRRLNFIDYAEIHFISALHGTNVGNLYEAVEKAHESATKSLQTKRLTEILEAAVDMHQPPLVSGRRIKLRFAHAGGSNPPIIVIHGNQTNKLPDHYKRFLEKTFRRELNLWGTPVKLEFKTGDNPYSDRANKFSTKEKFKRERLEKNRKRGKDKSRKKVSK